MKTPRVEPMSRRLAARTVKFYVCSACWSALIVKPSAANPELDDVLCPNCETPGYVSKRFVKRRESESVAEAMTARDNLRDALPFLNPYAQKQTSELIADLFGG